MSGPLIVPGVLAVWMVAVWLLFTVAEWVSPQYGEAIAGYITMTSFAVGLIVLVLFADGGGLDPADTYRR